MKFLSKSFLPFYTDLWISTSFSVIVLIFSMFIFQDQRLEGSLSGAAFESKIKAAARKLFSNLGIDDEVKYFLISFRC